MLIKIKLLTIYTLLQFENFLNNIQAIFTKILKEKQLNYIFVTSPNVLCEKGLSRLIIDINSTTVFIYATLCGVPFHHK